MRFPVMEKNDRKLRTVRSFGGMNTLARPSENEFSEIENIRPGNGPSLSVREKRGTLADLGSGKAALFYNDGAGWVTGSGALYYRKSAVQGGNFSQNDERICVNTGSKVLFFPDKTYFDTLTGERGTLFENFSCTAQTHATVGLVFEDGSEAASVTWGHEPPSNPSNGAVYFYGGEDGCRCYRYNEYGDSDWHRCGSTRYKFAQGSLPGNFREGDVVFIENSNGHNFDGTYTVAAAGTGYITLEEAPDQARLRTLAVAGSTTGYKTGFFGSIKRMIPDVSCACVCGNRVWAASSDGHEIYASRLGDPFNWYAYEDLASDSYAVTVGSDGLFTGCAVYDGKPLFFKNDCIIKIYGDKPANFGLVESPCHGVASGSGKSVTLCHNALFYLGEGGVYAYNGSYPVCVSEKIGNEKLSSGIGGCYGGRYYLSAQNSGGYRKIYVYDIAAKLWYTEDDPGVSDILSTESGIYFSVLRNGTSSLVRAAGAIFDGGYISSETAEGTVCWKAATGEFFVTEPFDRRISRIWLSLDLPGNSVVGVRAEYDRGAGRIPSDTRICTGGGMKKICFAPKKCESFRLVLEGTGPCDILSVSVLRNDLKK